MKKIFIIIFTLLIAISPCVVKPVHAEEYAVFATGWQYTGTDYTPLQNIKKVIFSSEIPSSFDYGPLPFDWSSIINGYVVGDDLIISAGDKIIQLQGGYSTLGSEESNGYFSKTSSIENINSLDTSGYLDMAHIFSYFGKTCEDPIYLNLNELDVSNALSFMGTFDYVGFNASNSITIDVSSWTFSNDTPNLNMTYLFSHVGQNATNSPITINAPSWVIPVGAEVSNMFFQVGQNNANKTTINVSNWDTSEVKDMHSMFYGVCQYGTGPLDFDISKWDVSNVTNMESMFSRFANHTESHFSLDLSKWDVSNVENFENFMFQSFESINYADLNLSNWTIKDGANTNQMFDFVNSTIFTGNVSLDLSNMKNLNQDVGDTKGMFGTGGTINNPNLKIDLSGYSAVENAVNPFKGETIGNIGNIIIPNKTIIIDENGNPTGEYIENSKQETSPGEYKYIFHYNKDDIFEFGDDATKISYLIKYNIDDIETKKSILEDDFINGDFTIDYSPQKSGKKFMGWYKNQDFSGDRITVLSLDDFASGELILYAKYVDNPTPYRPSDQHIVLNTGIY